MPSLIRAGLAVMCLAAAGCHTYQPYGYGYGYTGPYTAPQGDGGLYAPGAPVGPTPVVVPSATPPSTFPPSSGYQPTSPGRITEIPGSGTGTGASPVGSGKSVPNYADPPPAGTRPNPLGDDADEFKKPVGMRRPGGAQLQSFTDDSEENLAVMGDESFGAPPHLQNGSTPGDNSTRQIAKSRPNPYGYDRNAYSYLRGVAEYDDADQAWHVTYNPSPTPDDVYGGRMALVDNPALAPLLPHDVVYVEGEVDPSQRDRAGKPKYHVHTAQRLRPRSH